MSVIKIKTATVERLAWSGSRGAARVERPAWKQTNMEASSVGAAQH